MKSMAEVNKAQKTQFVVQESLVIMGRQVLRGADRDHMEAQAELLRGEATLERRMWGNRAGAERLEWRADLVELVARSRFPIPGNPIAYSMADRVREQLQVMCRGLIDNSESAGASRQVVKMALVTRRVRLDDIAEVIAGWGPLCERQVKPATPRRPILGVIDGGQAADDCPRRPMFR